MVNVAAADVPPPGAGLTTVTLAVPADATSVAGIVAVNCVALTKIVVRVLPFHRTLEPLTKPVPLTVNVKPALPAMVAFGEIDVIAGAGLLIVNVAAGDDPPPGAGLLTTTLAVPAVAMSLAVIAAVNC